MESHSWLDPTSERRDRAILPDGPFALKLQGMTQPGTLQAAWTCAQCRRYRRVALMLVVAAACSLILL
jgi:hypothetical protein